LQEGVCVLRQILVDGVFEGLPVVGVVGAAVGWGGGVVGGVFFLEAENHGSHIAGVESGYYRLWSVVVFGWENVGCL